MKFLKITMCCLLALCFSAGCLGEKTTSCGPGQQEADVLSTDSTLDVETVSAVGDAFREDSVDGE